MVHLAIISELALVSEVKFANRLLLIFFIIWDHLYRPYYVIIINKMKLAKQNNIKMDDIKFQPSFHCRKRTDGLQKQPLIQKQGVDQTLTAQQQSLIISTERHSKRFEDDEPLNKNALRNKRENLDISSDVIANLKKNSFVRKSSRTNSPFQKEDIVQIPSKPEGANVRFKKTSLNLLKLQNQSLENPLGSIFVENPFEQRICNDELNLNKIKQYLKTNRKDLEKKAENKKRNSCSLPSIYRTDIEQERKRTQTTFVQDDKKSPGLDHVQRNLKEEYNAIHERPNSKVVMAKLPKRKREANRHQRAQTQLNSEPFSTVLTSDKKKLAKKYEQSLKVHYAELSSFCSKNQQLSVDAKVV